MYGITTRKFSRRGFAAMLLGAVLTGGVRPVLAAVDPAEGYVGKIAEEVMSLANSGAKGTALRGRFASVLNRYVNLRNIANFALGPYQKKLPPGDKNEFYTLFNNYAAALFVFYVDDFKGSDLQIISTSKQGKFTTIVSAIRQNGGGRDRSGGDSFRRAAATRSVTSMLKGCGSRSRRRSVSVTCSIAPRVILGALCRIAGSGDLVIAANKLMSVFAVC